MAKLIFLGEKFGGRVYEIAAHRTTVGRGDTNTLSIHDSSVSEQHCEIYDNGEDLIIRDLGSLNGTVVNGKLLRAAQGPLAHGEIVKFGEVEARVEIPRGPATNDTVTAIHFRVPKAAARPPTSNSTVVLDAGAESAPTGHTMTLSRPEPPTPATPTLPPAPAPRTKLTLLYILAAIGLTMFLWWILRH